MSKIRDYFKGKKWLTAALAIWVIFSSIYTVYNVFTRDLFPPQDLKLYQLQREHRELQNRLDMEIEIRSYEDSNKTLSDDIQNLKNQE